ncbi:hypothetical protein [Calothrix sp. UHCC 0171]|uniref:hypothetical protein n=1 Tax=Calothrix sp. UHCC 0171 TaxID=3110245 RepID=UPI002B214466|nr:hypothetical protein [Calothrix sp. UHCC 0171]MEA5574509.1 hypothetical protein [Calothrix sp. UHCC 0171]
MTSNNKHYSYAFWLCWECAIALGIGGMRSRFGCVGSVRFTTITVNLQQPHL